MIQPADGDLLNTLTARPFAQDPLFLPRAGKDRSFVFTRMTIAPGKAGGAAPFRSLRLAQ
jgi:hypothetical protein